VKKLKDSPEVRKLHRQAIKWHNEKFDKLTGIKKVNGKLKLFTPEADITYKMKKIVSAIKKAVVHLNILGLLFIVACGEDNNPTGNNNPPVNNDSLVFNLDSFALYGSGVVTNDTTLYNLFNSGDSVKMTFNAETNCTASDTAYINATCGNISSIVSNFELPSSFTLYGRYVNFGTAILLYIKSTSTKYIRVKNFKLYKVNPV